MSTLARYKYNDSLSKEQNVLCSHLCSMRLSQMSQALAEEFMEPNEGLLTFEERITKSADFRKERCWKDLPGKCLLRGSLSPVLHREVHPRQPTEP